MAAEKGHLLLFAGPLAKAPRCRALGIEGRTRYVASQGSGGVTMPNAFLLLSATITGN